MTLSQFKAYAKGYENHLFDLECLMVHAGYWAGYYSNAKRPKSLGTVLKELCERHTKTKESVSTKDEKPEVDVDEFLRREQSFNRRKRERERTPVRRRR